MMVSSIGFGVENCGVGNYSGLRFWDDDPFQTPNLGVAGSNARVLISGGGDGALQDFIRILTFKSAGNVYRLLTGSDEFGNSVIDEATRIQMETRLLCAEDQAQRAYIWAETRRHDHDIHSALHRVYTNEVDKLRASSLWDKICSVLDEVVGPFVPDVALAYPCDHFSRCYGLNRFLTLLLDEYLRDRLRRESVWYVHSKKYLLPATRIENVRGTGHRCARKPYQCHGLDHEVTFRVANDCFSSPLPPNKILGTYNVIIIRHGPTPPLTGLVHGGMPISFPRQVLPYHLSA